MQRRCRRGQRNSGRARKAGLRPGLSGRGTARSPRGPAPGKAGKAEKTCGGNNSPRAPLIPPRASPSAGHRWKGSSCCRKWRALGKVGTADAGVLGGRGLVCGRSAGVSLRTHLRWPTPVRRLPDSRVKGRDFRMFCWRRTRLDVIELISVQQPGGKCLPENLLSTLWGPRPAFRRSRRRA